MPSPTITRHAAGPDDIALLHAALRAIAPLSDEDLARLPTGHRLHLAKGAYLLRAGDQAGECAFVLQGGLREFYVLADGTERTKSFNFAGGLAGSLSDLLSGEPSRVWVQAQADTVLLTTPWAPYLALTQSEPAWQGFARRVAEDLYMAKVQREYELLALDAAERYALALARWPLLEALFSQRDIASYIGVTPVHLSRLRAARARAAPTA